MPVHAMAHITGGGIVENLPRVMPDYTQAQIDTNAWQRPAIFDWLQMSGNIANREMLRTFNCGIGMIVCVAADKADAALAILQQQSRGAVILGQISKSEQQKPVVTLTGNYV
jgi:phosphoribosylformylglycinamidine cyclo-ligase